MTKDDQIKGMSQLNRGSVGFQEALAKQEQQVVSLQCAHCQVTIDTLNNKVMSLLAKQEQGEPVAIVDANDDGYWADILPDRSVKVGQLLYTTPQPAQLPEAPL